ncbi:hypothetical protein QDT91_08750 [Mycolicibacterium aubagnense]|uniref:DUF6985 domain-containing protein n=1 Tax=Mycolicibacterium aubagnense TaxID=319707 RepID=UPI001F432DBD|nr:hypothetical protein [Mycolicibacterium aubagnense]WGI34409.1 hypothetical protein QDT91_08750 [Mycolicibacterium aubagnense]
MTDPVLGDIAFDDARGWLGAYTYAFFGREVTVPLVLGGWEEGEPVEPLQREAVQAFNLQMDQLCAQAEDALYAEYLERRPGLREQFGADADKLMPIISDESGLVELLTPTTFFVPVPACNSDERVIGLLFDCTWEPELGVAVKFVDETVAEVGPQDIVL